MSGIAFILNMAFTVYRWLLIARILMSWLPVSGSNPVINAVTNFIYEVTEPFLEPFRRLIPISSGMPVDFSPIIAFFVLGLIQSLVLRFF